MEHITSRTKALSIRFKVSTVIACYDIQEVIGRNPVNKAMSTVIAQSLDAIVATLRNEGKLPTYTDDAALQERLMQMIGVQKAEEVEEPEAVTALINRNTAEQDPDFEEAFEATALSVPQKDPVQVDRPIEIVPVPVHSAPAPATFSDLLEAWPDDKLLASCKGNPIHERAIAILYANMPKSQWDSPLAQTLLASALKLHAETVEQITKEQK